MSGFISTSIYFLFKNQLTRDRTSANAIAVAWYLAKVTWHFVAKTGDFIDLISFITIYFTFIFSTTTPVTSLALLGHMCSHWKIVSGCYLLSLLTILCILSQSLSQTQNQTAPSTQNNIIHMLLDILFNNFMYMIICRWNLRVRQYSPHFLSCLPNSVIL